MERSINIEVFHGSTFSASLGHLNLQGFCLAWHKLNQHLEQIRTVIQGSNDLKVASKYTSVTGCSVPFAYIVQTIYKSPTVLSCDWLVVATT